LEKKFQNGRLLQRPFFKILEANFKGIIKFKINSFDTFGLEANKNEAIIFKITHPSEIF
jgi:hypothetical protein